MEIKLNYKETPYKCWHLIGFATYHDTTQSSFTDNLSHFLFRGADHRHRGGWGNPFWMIISKRKKYHVCRVLSLPTKQGIESSAVGISNPPSSLGLCWPIEISDFPHPQPKSMRSDHHQRLGPITWINTIRIANVHLNFVHIVSSTQRTGGIGPTRNHLLLTRHYGP